MVCMIDVSILIVHYNTPGLLRQTLKGIFRVNPTVSYEVIVVDNNPNCRIKENVKTEFPQMKVLVSSHNIGFGRGMNMAMEIASGRYFFVFNPDIILMPDALESLTRFMDSNPDVGIVGPKLLNPDGTVQHSCYRFMEPMIVAYRRVPFLRCLSFAKRAVDAYLMIGEDMDNVKDVDYLLGAAMFVRNKAIEQVGGFDPEFFVYFEDQDWCRRFWLAGWRVVYNPEVSLTHYHRRETAEGRFFVQLFNPLTRVQIKSALYYYKKNKGTRHGTQRGISLSRRS